MNLLAFNILKLHHLKFETKATFVIQPFDEL